MITALRSDYMKNLNKEIFYKVNDNSVTILKPDTGAWSITSKNNCFNLGINYIDIINNKEAIIDYINNHNMLPNPIIEKPCENRINLFIIDTTNICNFRCKYCSVNASDCGSYLDYQTLMRGFHKFLDLPNINDYLTIEFSGGEPLINYDLIEKSVPEIKRICDNNNICVKFAIQTNGALLNDDIADFLSKYNFSIGISIDGYKKWNINRINSDDAESYDKVIRTIRMLNEKNISFSTLGVVYNPKQYLEYLQFARENNIKQFRLNTLTNIGRSKTDMDLQNSIINNLDEYVVEYIKLAKELILNEEYHGYKEANLTYALMALLDYMPHMCFRTPCGAGCNQLHLSADGYFYPCQDWRSINDSSIDSVNSDCSLQEKINDSKRIDFIRKGNVYNYSQICDNCDWRKRCGICARELYSEYKDDGKKIALCKFYNEIYEELLDIIYTNREDIMKYLFIGYES